MYTLILGFDAFDPRFFEGLLERGLLPNLARYTERDGYARFSVSNPPQSEVSWTSIATGLNPGGHGIFDFVHRDPQTYTPFVSLLPTKRGLAGIQFAHPFSARTLFEQAARNGYPATSLWWPATFPAHPQSPVSTFPGLGTPDLHGKLGVGTLYTSDSGLKGANWKTYVEVLQQAGRDRYTGALKGPIRKKRWGAEDTLIPLELQLLDDRQARLQVARDRIELEVGKWSQVLELAFQLGPLMKVRALTRAILTQARDGVRLYFLPLQIHPLNSPWPYATPPGFVKKTWKDCGPFLTLGWPQDTTGLEDGCISDDQFLDLCASICEKRFQVLEYHLSYFKEGVLGSVFDSLDRIQHMFFRDHPDVIEGWYVRLDAIVGRVEAYVKDRVPAMPRILIVSDHGFAHFNYKVHLNRWLLEKGYLAAKESDGTGSLQSVDWTRSQAYALGLNSLYLNLAGREGQGQVTVEQVEPLLNRLQADLSAWRGPDGSAVVQQAYPRSAALSGALISYGPDLLVGYAPGYRASQQTGLGAWEGSAVEVNRDHWQADHCIDPAAVDGVLFSSTGLAGYPQPSYRDFPMLAIGEELEAGGGEPPPSHGGEEQEIIEERLKSLGYL
jgi:predicted AlkP superfamily phosphohydrolase/phosphomutase